MMIVRIVIRYFQGANAFFYFWHDRKFRARARNAILENQNEGVSDDWQVDNFARKKN